MFIGYIQRYFLCQSNYQILSRTRHKNMFTMFLPWYLFLKIDPRFPKLLQCSGAVFCSSPAFCPYSCLFTYFCSYLFFFFYPYPSLFFYLSPTPVSSPNSVPSSAFSNNISPLPIYCFSSARFLLLLLLLPLPYLFPLICPYSYFFCNFPPPSASSPTSASTPASSYPSILSFVSSPKYAPSPASSLFSAMSLASSFTFATTPASSSSYAPNPASSPISLILLPILIILPLFLIIL